MDNPIKIVKVIHSLECHAYNVKDQGSTGGGAKLTWINHEKSEEYFALLKEIGALRKLLAQAQP